MIIERNLRFYLIFRLHLETALGVKLDDTNGSALYRKTIHDIELIILERTFNPLMFYEVIFKWFGKYDQHKREVGIAHDFSSKIIKKKREEYRQKKATGQDMENEQ